MSIESILIYMAIGAVAGIISGMLGIGGGMIIIPALVYIAGYSQFSATGTSIAVMLPPIGLLAAIEYYRRGHVNLTAAIIISICMMLASWVGARFTHRINDLYLRIGFGLMLAVLGVYMVVSALRKLHT